VNDQQEQELILPAGIRGVDFGFAVLMLTTNMLVLSPKGSRLHYTFQVKPEVRRFNLHSTMDHEDRKGILNMSFDELEQLIVQRLAPQLPLLLRLVRTLRMPWLLRQPIVAVQGLWDPTQRLLEGAPQRKRKLVLDIDYLTARAEVLDDVEALGDLEAGACFSLFRCRLPRQVQHIGDGFVVPRPGGRRQLRWIPRHAAQALIADFRLVLSAPVDDFVRPAKSQL
jgi:hypothetical protein